MRRKWPLKVPDSYLERKICDLRKEYGIQILLSPENQRPLSIKSLLNGLEIKNP